MMSRRDFPRFDSATEQNLRVLESHADQDGSPGDFEMIHTLVTSSIDLMKMLPSTVARHFDQGAFFIGASHERGPPQRRMEIWQRLAAKLAAGLDAVRDDPALKAGAITEDRPQTRGERIDELCRELASALSAGRDLTSLLAQIELEASGTAASADVRQMRRLVSMKRIPDRSRWESDFHYSIAHARRVAWQLHGMPALHPSREPGVSRG